MTDQPGEVRLIRAAIVAIVSLLVVGCGSMEFAAPGGYVSYDEAERAVAPEPSQGITADMERAEAQPSPVAQTDSAPAERPAQQRLRVYSGRLTLSVARVERARESIIETVAALDGYVERSQADLLVVRVPAERFAEAMTRIETEGDVESRSVETADVTAQYADIERRLEIVTTSRQRLYDLLERSEDADERVAILRDIRRLTEEMEQLQSSLESLSELVAYSRITVTLVARIQITQVMREEIPFAWVAGLDPLRVTMGDAAERLEYTVPETFAAFSEGVRIRAESADGSRIRMGARENQPAGDAEFWTSALQFHLAAFYRSADEYRAGEFSGVLFTSKDAEPYSYLVMTRVRGDELVVLECFFPSDESRQRLLPAVREMVDGGAS